MEIEGLPEMNKKPSLTNKQNKEVEQERDKDDNFDQTLINEGAYLDEYDNIKRRVARANAFRALRMKRNWSQEKMAKTVGASLRAYKYFESAQKEVSMKNLDRWLDCLGEGYLTIAY